MQFDKFALAAEWRATARENERIATMLIEESPATAAFLAQQAAEKALKAACIAVGEDAPRTHVVNYLLDELATNGIDVADDVRDAARLLERFYAPTRYPDALGGIDPNRIFVAHDARQAVEALALVVAFVDIVIARARPST
ncbi:MAG: hypothetical protein NVS3B17_08870 [Vulcanimicrobiaceae bacterium]